MRILGIDPGFAIVGWGIIDYDGLRFHTVAYGSVQTKAGLDPVVRFNMIFDGLNEIIAKYKPEVMGIEELFWNTNQKTGIMVAEARGIILLAAYKSGLTIAEYTPLQVKQSVVGYGRAEKSQVIAMVTALLGLKEPPKPDDTADALAVAICYAHSRTSAIDRYYNK